MEVENKSAHASEGTNEVKASDASADKIDVAAILADNERLLNEVTKVSKDRDNYRAATLALKGKTGTDTLDPTDPVQLQALIQKTVEERLLAEQGSKTETDWETNYKELARKNKELALALSSKSNISNVGSGSSGGSVDVHVGYYSKEQTAALEKRWESQNIPKAKWPDMLKKAEHLAKEQHSGIA